MIYLIMSRGNPLDYILGYSVMVSATVSEVVRLLKKILKGVQYFSFPP